ncbi:MAG: hypothetical protein IK088_06370 [Lachnospiraceae bacterium]|nr:hypothetical protein [Lachnospiraceae bacterium]
MTVFFSLSLPLILILLFTLIESARYTGIRAASHAAGNNAIDSLFAEYNRTLLDEYGLMFYNGAPEGGFVDFDRIEADFLTYFRRNTADLKLLFGGSFLESYPLGVTVTEAVTATDYNGEIFIRSVLDFYKYDLAGEALETLKSALGLIQESGDLKEGADKDTDRLQSTDWGQVSMNDGGMIPAHVERIYDIEPMPSPGPPVPPSGPEPEGPVEEPPPPIDDKALKDDLNNSAIGSMERSKASGWLNLVLPANTSVSAYEMDQDDAPSLAAVDQRKLTENRSIITDLAEGAGFYEYILTHFSNYGKKLHESGMQYEIEYVLFGNASDVKNFETALNRIMWIREGMNLLYLVTSENRTLANSLAEAMVGWTGNELIVMLTATALMAAWAYAESILDVRALLQNKRVAFMKDEETWVLSLEGIGNLLAGGGGAAKESEHGMKYQDYLRILLYLSDVSRSSYRTMDLIQDRLRMRQPSFLMASEIYALEVRMNVGARELFTALPLVRKEAPHVLFYVFEETFSEVY